MFQCTKEVYKNGIPGYVCPWGYAVYHLACTLQSRGQTGMGVSVYIFLCVVVEYWASQYAAPGTL